MQRAEAVAEYLEQDHWGDNGQSAIPNRQPFFQNNSAYESPFKLQELNEALTKSNKLQTTGTRWHHYGTILKWLNKETGNHY